MKPKPAWSIRRILKTGRVGRGELAFGETEEDAWKNFNDAQMYLCYDQYTQFVSVKERQQS